jgi:hypothetical protein
MSGIVIDCGSGETRAVTPEELADIDAARAAAALAVPASVTPRQMRLALIQAGYNDAVQNYVAGINDPAVIVQWEYATQIDRNNALIATAAQGLGLNSAQVDSLFRLAATL